MRLGVQEIATIIIVVVLVLVVVRIVGAGRKITKKGKTSGETPNEQVARGSGKVVQRLRAAGIIFIIIGIISLLAGMSMFKWVYWSYLWSFVAFGIGFAMVFISRKK